LINVGCYVLRGLAEDSKCDKQSIDDDDDDCNINFDLKDERLMNLMNVEGGLQMVTLKKKQFDAMTRKKKGLNRIQQETLQKK
jgi:hypothetical protein